MPNEDQTEEPGPTENRQTGVPDENQTEEPGATEPQTGVPDEEPGATENPQTGVPDEGKTEEPNPTVKPKGKGPKRVQGTAEEGGEAKKQKTTKEAHFVLDISQCMLCVHTRHDRQLGCRPGPLRMCTSHSTR